MRWTVLSLGLSFMQLGLLFIAAVGSCKIALCPDKATIRDGPLHIVEQGQS